jgi:glutamate N-acetyltransferase/amino-acid N-acetyltransferase
MRKVSTGIRKAVAALDPNGAGEAEKAIMTTDTRPKSIAVEFSLDGRPVRVGGMAKGAGMIAPSMATMLAFITTDADLAPGLLQSCLLAAVNRSFHRITVDGDTSTNDTVLLLANGQSEAGKVTTKHGLARFQAALDRVCIHLAREIVRDGEGASKFIEIAVSGADSEQEAQRIAKTIANSPLVKTAIAGGDANWGRILAAAGRAGVRFKPDLVDLRLGDVQVVSRGAVSRHDQKAAARAVAGDSVRIGLDLNAGRHSAVAWTCDLTAGYIKINADYHT